MPAATEHSPLVQLDEQVALAPICFSRLDCANEVRRAMAAWRPECVAVEAPAEIAAELIGSLGRLPKVSLVAWRLRGQAEARYLSTDPCDGRIEALRMAGEFGLPVALLDSARFVAPGLPPLPDAAVFERVGGKSIATMLTEADEAPGDGDRLDALSRSLAGAVQEGRRVLAVVEVRTAAALLRRWSDGAPDPGERDWADVSHALAVPVDARLLPFAVHEAPYIAHLYETWRAGSGPGDAFPIADALHALLHKAEDQYEDEYDERISRTEWRALVQYARNLALGSGRLRASFVDLVNAAQGCVDGDYAAILLETALSYPPNEIDGDGGAGPQHQSLDLYVDFDGEKLKAEPAYPAGEMREETFSLKRRRPSARQKRRWRLDFHEEFGGSICSWPPEDERIEKFFDFLRKRALSQVSDEHTAVEEFSTSTLDGLDYRETVRNWNKRKLFVKRERMPPGRVGPALLIWRDLPLETDDLWRTTLYAENQNESDICVYCSPMGRDMVGPRIARTEYHGILSIFPARGIPDLWSVPMLYGWETHARLLLAGAVLLSQDKYIAYAAPEPPDRELIEFARHYHRAIVYLPLASFSKKTLKRLRQVHVLGGHEVRDYAADYIDS